MILRVDLFSVAVGVLFGMAFCLCLPGEGMANSSKVVIENEIPYGEREGALMARGSKISALLCIRSLKQEDLQVELSLAVPYPLEVSSEDPSISVSPGETETTVRSSLELRVEGEKWFGSITVAIPENAPPGEYVIRSEARVQNRLGIETVVQPARLRVVTKEAIPGLFRMGNAELPCNENGEPEERHERNTVLIKGKKSFWNGLVEDEKKASRFDTQPSTYLVAPVRNTSPHKAILLVRMDILDPATGETAPGFELPYAAEHGDTLGEVAIYQVVEMNPQSEERVTLPFYVNEDTARPGVYKARIRSFLFGTDIEADSRELTVRVVGIRWTPALMTASSLIAALGGFFFSYRQRKRYLGMKGSELILISLFGAVMFAVVSIPGTLLLSAAHIILGPLSFLVTGFFHEVLFYLLLVSLVVLIPQVGTVSLVIAVRFLMSSFVLGEFSPISLLYHATNATCLEAAVYLSGLTRRDAASVDLPATVVSQPVFNRRQVLLAAVVLGVTDMFLSFVFFNLSMFFYRLYYATWYVGAYLVIDGFLFTLIAVPFGFKLGSRLKAAASV